jgi:hypothetical protein
MLTAACIAFTIVVVLAWLADANARRTAWRNIASARRVSAAERAELAAHATESCPHCHAAVRYTH